MLPKSVYFLSDMTDWAFDISAAEWVRALNGAGCNAIRRSRRFLDLEEAANYEWVVALWWPFVEALRPLREKGVKISARLADRETWTGWTHTAWRARFLNIREYVDLWTCDSEEIAEIARLDGLENVIVVPNPVDPLKFYEKEWTQTPPGKKLVIGWCGKPESLKWLGIDDCKGWKTLAEPLKGRLDIEFRAALGGLKPEEMPAWFAGLDAFICTSKTEGTPRPVVEAMMTGIPVISTKVGVVPELVLESSGVSIFDGTPEDLNRWISMLIKDPAYRLQAGRKNRDAAVKHRSSEASAGLLHKALWGSTMPPSKRVWIWTGEYEGKTHGVGTSSRNLHDALKNELNVVTAARLGNEDSRDFTVLKDGAKRKAKLAEILGSCRTTDVHLFEYADMAHIVRALSPLAKKYYRAHGVHARYNDIEKMGPVEFGVSRQCEKQQRNMAAAGCEILAIGSTGEHECHHAFPNSKIGLLPNSLRLQESERSGVLFLGSCYRRKGIWEALGAAKLTPEYHFSFIGEAGPDGLKRSFELKNATHIQHISDPLVVSQKLRQARILIFPSFYEGIPYTILEACRELCPVLTYAFSGVRDIGLHPACIVEEMTPEALAYAIKDLYNSPMRQEMALHNFRAYADRYLAASQLNSVKKIVGAK